MLSMSLTCDTCGSPIDPHEPYLWYRREGEAHDIPVHGVKIYGEVLSQEWCHPVDKGKGVIFIQNGGPASSLPSTDGGSPMSTDRTILKEPLTP